MKEKVIRLYLSGSVPKSKEDESRPIWGESEVKTLEMSLPDFTVRFFNPVYRSDDLNDVHATFGRDMLQVACCDIVVVDGRAKRGVGVGAEMAFAKMNRIPVISVLPDGSHYSRRDMTCLGQHLETWTHPFLASMSDIIVEDIHQVGPAVQTMLHRPKADIKGPECFYSAMRHYVETQLDTDVQMNSLVRSDHDVSEKISRLTSDWDAGTPLPPQFLFGKQ